MIWLLCGYMWLFIHRPFEVWPWLGAFHIERIYMLVTIAVWAVLAEKRWISNRLTMGFVLLALAIVASALLSPYTGIGDVTVQNWFKIAVFYVLLLSSVHRERDLKVLVTAFVVCFGLYMLHSLREYLCGRYIYRMGIARMVGVDSEFGGPNTFGISIVYALPMITPGWELARKKWQRWALLAYFALSVGCILLTGSRTTFVALLVLVLIVALRSRHRVKALVALAVVAPLLWNSLADDLRTRYTTLIEPSMGPKSAEASAHSRLELWYVSVELWKKHRTFGVGPGAFQKASGWEIQAHTLYGQLLSELGNVGVVAFLVIVVSFYRNYTEIRRLARDRPDVVSPFLLRVSNSVMVTVILLFVGGLGGHNLFRYTWLWYGAFQVIALFLLRKQAGSWKSRDKSYHRVNVQRGAPAHA
jgi:O-antigen ligase